MSEDLVELELIDRHAHAVASVDCELRFIYMNAAAERLFGGPRQNWLGRHVLEFEALPPESRRAWERNCQTVLQYARVVRQPLECGALKRRATLSICPQIAPDGSITGLLNIVEEYGAAGGTQDAPMRAGAGEYGARLEEARMLTMLSHELRTPLNAILGWIQTLRSGLLQADAASRALEQIEHSARKQARLLDSMLNSWKAVTAAPDAHVTPRQHSPDPLAMLLQRRALQGLRIVAVDDDANTREMLREALARAGASVWCAADAEEALRAVQRHLPDVLVSDIGMPGQDGLALLRNIRVLPAEQGGMTPAIALTGYVDEADRSAIRQAGYQATATKPVNLADLLSTILGAAGRR